MEARPARMKQPCGGAGHRGGWALAWRALASGRGTPHWAHLSSQCVTERGRVDDPASTIRPRTWHSRSSGGRTPSRRTPCPEGWLQWPQRGQFTVAAGSARRNRRGGAMGSEGGLRRRWRRECRAIGVARSLAAPLQGAVRAGAFPQALLWGRAHARPQAQGSCAWNHGPRRALPQNGSHDTPPRPGSATPILPSCRRRLP